MEEVGQAVEEDEGLGSSVTGSEFVVGETHDDESDGENDESHKLDGLASPRVDEEEGNPVPWDETSNGQDQVTNANVPQVGVDFPRSRGGWSAETDGGQNDGRVETKTVESDLKDW